MKLIGNQALRQGLFIARSQTCLSRKLLVLRSLAEGRLLRIVMTELFSVSEAAAIAEVSPEAIRTALEKKSVAPSFKRMRGKEVRYEFSVGDVLLMKVLVEFPFALSKEDKLSLAKILSCGDRTARPAGRERVRT